jgi:hypothetical protein
MSTQSRVPSIRRRTSRSSAARRICSAVASLPRSARPG